ncbi:DeoR/GlpR family DNA-binding transcription regulator [Glycomyces algeriensis]|uniref:DeoR family transcriptional regulator n=1 Tax=Glycomyces algeriensis TaxID=256037 RepID=A0A9W6LDT6_9ACTN|nr:DeoR/GlpR family DNA-binding transcription regulator [Glycomyces algeriensis]MDA1368037.1 DeoR/GlpR family DNA-binding transcription regulator [Glycomyces algeriensis]MDR7352547.1 DeoR/GlpR family transcriptional regulator of sugar metabolism [Glycomyces algeriensis]GLI40227.1 DeoR family transcriptional regulator [Glycomyces algeriensis]
MGIADRLDLTLRLVQGSGRVSVAELAGRLSVSEMTVRRDLDELERRGLVRRVRGGAVATRTVEEDDGYAVREGWQAATKDRLGAAVAELVEPGSRVLLDAGTTIVHVAEHLAARGPLTVAVLSLQAAAVLADRPGIELIVIGGRSRPGERSLVGPLALRTLASLTFDVFIMSIGGVHPDHGWSEFSLDDAAVKQIGLEQAASTVAVADATKLGVRAFSSVAPLEAVGRFVTDRSASDDATHPGGPPALRALREAGVETHLV